MKIFKHIILICILASLAACQSTHYSNHHYNEQPVVSDYSLMLMLAHRPQTQDMKMMQLYARRSYEFNGQSVTMSYLPEGQENPINFMSFNPDSSVRLLPALMINPQTPSIKMLGERTQL